MSHYETLGVQKDATATDIKKAYRRKASAAHPDKGGSDEEMAKLNRAMAVLDDPARREQYDRTGSDGDGPTVEERARSALMSLFLQAIERSDDNIVDVLGRVIEEQKDDLAKKRREQQKLRERFAKRRSKVSTRDGVENLAHLIIDDQVRKCDQALASMDDFEKVVNACERMLKAYTDQTTAPVAAFVVTSGTSTSSTWWR